MDTLAWIVLGFLVASVGVAALARSTTARWEREARATRVRRRHADADATPGSRHRLALRLGRALGTAAATARPVAEPVRGLLTTTGRRLAALRRRGGAAAAVRAEPPRPASRGRRRRSAAARGGAEPAPALPRRTRPLSGWAVHRSARSRARQPSDEQRGPVS